MEVKIKFEGNVTRITSDISGHIIASKIIEVFGDFSEHDKVVLVFENKITNVAPIFVIDFLKTLANLEAGIVHKLEVRGSDKVVDRFIFEINHLTKS